MIASLTRSTFARVLIVLAGPDGLVFNNEPVVLSALTHLNPSISAWYITVTTDVDSSLEKTLGFCH